MKYYVANGTDPAHAMGTDRRVGITKANPPPPAAGPWQRKRFAASVGWLISDYNPTIVHCLRTSRP